MRLRLTAIIAVSFLVSAVAVWIYAATPSQILSSGAAFQANSDRDLKISQVYLLSLLAGVTPVPATILSNAAPLQSMSDRDLAISAVSLLNNLSGGLLVKSNTLASIPVLSPGDTYYWSSNGVAYVITDSPSGVLVTNKLGP
jgi:hypothetical protein